MAKTQDTMIPATISQVGKTEIIYEPDLHLNLTELFPVISSYGYLLNSANNKQIKDMTDSKFSIFEAISQTLDELERQLEDFALN